MAQPLRLEAEILELRTRTRSSSRAAARATTAPSGCGCTTPTGSRAGARPRRTGSTARPPRRCWPRSTSTPRRCPTIRSTSRRPSAAGSSTLRVQPVGARGALDRAARPRRQAARRSGATGSGGSIPRKAPRSTFTIGIDTPERIRLKVREAAEYPDPQDQAGHRSRPRDPAGHSRASPTRKSGSTPTAAGP